MDIQSIHKYNRLVRRGLVEPLKCHTCGYDYSFGVNKELEPVFICMTCESRLSPGKNFQDKIMAILKEFYL